MAIRTESEVATGRERNAFTLVELAVVLIIIGILGPLFYNVITSYVAKEKIETAQRTLELAREQMVGAMLSGSGLLPDPDSDLVPGSLGVNVDPWQSRIVYWRAPALASAGVGSVSETNLEVRLYDDVGSGGTFPDGSASLDRVISNIAYVLVSPGKNLTLDTVIDTSGAVWTVSILKNGGPLEDGSGRDFDDVVEYVPLSQLQTIYNASGG